MKNHKLLLTGMSLFLLALSAFSQPICAFDDNHERLLKEDSNYRKNILANEAKIQEFIRKNPGGLTTAQRESSVNTVLYTIPVVVHVIHTGGAIGTIYNPTDAQITGAINYLNQVYNGTYPGIQGVGDLQVQFALATRDTNCNASTGIDRIDGSSLTNYATNGVNSATSGGVTDLALKNFDRWDPVNYYNIWVVNKIDAKDGTSGQFIAGYAYFAGAPITLDGTVMLATQMVTGQKTLPHEIGHALSLYHPFQGSPDAATCPSNANCNTDGDMVCDTDPITYNQTGGVVNFSCRAGTNSCTGTAYTINTESNYMNYTSCYTLFTAGQKARMLAAMSLPSRQSLVTSSATGTYPESPYVAPLSACAPNTQPPGLSSDFAGVINVALANKSFGSGATADDNGYVDKTSKCLYLVQLQNSQTYNFTITLLGQNNEQLRMWIDYDNNGVFSNATEQIYYSANITATNPGVSYTTVTGSFTVPATAITNATLRMRVMDEVSTVYGAGYAINSACYPPQYGQAEDYPVVMLAALPVTFQYFNGIKKDNDAVLTWKTSFEENAKEFQVQKSTDGVAFSTIGTVPASDNMNGAIYSFTDNNITDAVNYYRISEVDKDLKSGLSQVIIIKSGADKDAKLKVINNPFIDQLDIVFNGVTAANTTINLFDITGRRIFSKEYKITDGQVEHIDLSGTGIKPGMYILQAQIADKVITAKVIKQ
jgi:Pregnancy-associated plasma protein-A/GEVED domain/Secretion system C-terminal sorting domain